MDEGWQVMWQCGKLYEKEYQGMTREGAKVQAFIEDMSVAYAAADAIVAGKRHLKRALPNWKACPSNSISKRSGRS